MRFDSTQPSLLRRLRDTSDHRAWLRFHDAYGEFILRYALRRGLSLTEAEDVRQEVLIGLSRTFPRFEYRPERGRFRGYLSATVRHAVARHLSRQIRASEVPLLHDVVDSGSTPDAADEDRVWNDEWVAHHLRLAFDKLSEILDARTLDVFSRLLDGDSTSSITAATGLSAEAVYKIKQRVRDRMQALVREQMSDEDHE